MFLTVTVSVVHFYGFKQIHYCIKMALNLTDFYRNSVTSYEQSVVGLCEIRSTCQHSNLEYCDSSLIWK